MYSKLGVPKTTRHKKSCIGTFLFQWIYTAAALHDNNQEGIIFLPNNVYTKLAHSCGCSINHNDKRKEFLRKLSSGTNQRMK